MAKKEGKKALRAQVEKSLTEHFLNIKAAVGEKKFLKKIKKAGKILSAGAFVKPTEATPAKISTATPKKAKGIRKTVTA